MEWHLFLKQSDSSEKLKYWCVLTGAEFFQKSGDLPYLNLKNIKSSHHFVPKKLHILSPSQGMSTKLFLFIYSFPAGRKSQVLNSKSLPPVHSSSWKSSSWKSESSRSKLPYIQWFRQHWFRVLQKGNLQLSKTADGTLGFFGADKTEHLAYVFCFFHFVYIFSNGLC